MRRAQRGGLRQRFADRSLDQRAFRGLVERFERLAPGFEGVVEGRLLGRDLEAPRRQPHHLFVGARDDGLPEGRAHLRDLGERAQVGAATFAELLVDPILDVALRTRLEERFQRGAAFLAPVRRDGVLGPALGAQRLRAPRLAQGLLELARAGVALLGILFQGLAQDGAPRGRQAGELKGDRILTRQGEAKSSG